MSVRFLSLGGLVLLCTACGNPPSGFKQTNQPSAEVPKTAEAKGPTVSAPTAAAPTDRLPTFVARSGFVATPPKNAMRVAQFTLPKVDGDSEDAELIVFHFAAQQGGGGGVEANLNRWKGQFRTADGQAVPTVKATAVMSDGVEIRVFEIEGTFVAETAPGSGERLNKPGFAMIGGVIETTAGNYFPKLTGPAKTVARWREDMLAFLKDSFAPKK